MIMFFLNLPCFFSFQYGLYSAFVGCFVYAVFGSCKDITIGPTALMSLMTYQQIINRNKDFAILLCFLSGCVQILMSILHLGELIVLEPKSELSLAPYRDVI